MNEEEAMFISMEIIQENIKEKKNFHEYQQN